MQGIDAEAVRQVQVWLCSLWWGGRGAGSGCTHTRLPMHAPSPQEPPAVKLNAALGGLLDFKLAGEDALRGSGIPFSSECCFSILSHDDKLISSEDALQCTCTLPKALMWLPARGKQSSWA